MPLTDISTYLADRDSLMRQDRALRVDAIKLDNLSATEAAADEIVRAMKAEEAVSVWGAERADIERTFPGMEFLTSRSVITKTRVFELLHKMPKGALLHAHLDATVDVNFLLGRILEQDAIYVRTCAPLTALNPTANVLPEFSPFPKSEVKLSAGKSVTDPSYDGGWIPVKVARDNFSLELGGPEGFDGWYVASTTINPAEAYGTHKTVTKIWEKFRETFGVTRDVIRFSPIFEAYVREFLLSSIEDGISYVEARVNFLFKTFFGPDGRSTLAHRDMLRIYGDVVRGVKDEMKKQGREDEFVGSRIIYCTVKIVTPEELEWYTEDCLALKREFPDLIAGFDLVGPEDTTKPIVDYLVPLLRFKDRQRELGVEIPFIFHAGETLGDGTAADDNLYDAILLGTKRIGHGFSMIKHPKLMEICKERKIAIEVCPISNEILRYTTSIPMHPIASMLNHGMPVCLCSDDPSAFGNLGLSFDFYQVLVSSEQTGLITLGEIALDSLKYSTLEGEEKERAIAAWKKRWVKFLEDVVRDASDL
ncbi:hypothetical protein BJ322DRAFT_1094454 [Thelephora terrestris]|uniref:adenosine deaminase n=1 Tax=Thelephora terrestris TaxID=56493 RepID=A0A9P6H5K3_9AGAM|nr:hypothetical protein BJ322DRAFT_1094454 [Thelephora terrestris]